MDTKNQTPTIDHAPVAFKREEEGIFWTQNRAPSGHWCDRTGHPDLIYALESKAWEEDQGATCRVVTKTLNIVG
jgi:hypothetical protein